MLHNHLQNGQKYFHLQGISSSKNFINCGVPQASTLGPNLFLILINVLPDFVNTLLRITDFIDYILGKTEVTSPLFGDDTTLMCVTPTEKTSYVSIKCSNKHDLHMYKNQVP